MDRCTVVADLFVEWIVVEFKCLCEQSLNQAALFNHGRSRHVEQDLVVYLLVHRTRVVLNETIWCPIFPVTGRSWFLVLPLETASKHICHGHDGTTAMKCIKENSDITFTNIAHKTLMLYA